MRAVLRRGQKGMGFWVVLRCLFSTLPLYLSDRRGGTSAGHEIQRKHWSSSFSNKSTARATPKRRNGGRSRPRCPNHSEGLRRGHSRWLPADSGISTSSKGCLSHLPLSGSLDRPWPLDPEVESFTGRSTGHIGLRERGLETFSKKSSSGFAVADVPPTHWRVD